MFTLKKLALASVIVTIALLCSTCFLVAQTAPVAFNRTAFYTAFASDNITTIEKQLQMVSNHLYDGKEAFEGALMMKKAGLIKGASHKLKEFKAGREKLENMLSKDTNNAEFRFLRLMIQEKAPKILGYNKELEQDHQYVVKHFKSLPEAAQNAILTYSKSSNVLSPNDF